MPKLAAALDFAQLEARNLVAHQIGSDPAGPVKGQMYFNNANNTLWWYDGSAWVSARGGVSAVPPATTGALGTIQLAGDLAGTATSPQIAAGVITDAEIAAANKDGAVGTPSMRTLGSGQYQAAPGGHSHPPNAIFPNLSDVDFSAIVYTSAGGYTNGKVTDAYVAPANKDGTAGTPSMRTLGVGSAGKAMPGMASLSDISDWNSSTGPLSASSQKITNVANPTAPQEAATKSYVDQLATNTWKPACRVATEYAIALSGTQSIDGVALAVGDRVLVKNQGLVSANGIYVVADGSWSRPLDADSWSKVAGAVTYVSEGTVYADTLWRSGADKSGTLGTTALTWWILPSKIMTGQDYGAVMAGNHTLGSIGVANPNHQDVSVNSYKVTNLATPTVGSDASTKAYVDSVAQGLSAKASVRAATTGIITLSGEQTIDGVAVVTGDRVLVKDQASASPHGIYVAATGAWARASDADTWNELVSAYCWVEEGTANKDTGWVCTADRGGTLNSTGLDWYLFTSSWGTQGGAGLFSSSPNVLAVGQGAGITVAADQVYIGNAQIAAYMLADAAVMLSGSKVSGVLPVASGGTGSATAQAARQTLAAAFAYTFTGPPATGTTWDIDVAAFTSFARGCIVQVSDVATGVVELPDVTLSTPNATGIRISFGASVTLNTKRVTILGATS